MRAALAAVFAVILAAPSWAGGLAEHWTWTHVRWANESGRALLVEGVRRSAVVRNLVDDLEHSDVIVYVSGVMSAAPGAAGGCAEGVAAHLAFATAAGGLRYLHITLDTWRAGGWDAIPLLGHELQHALEVAAAPEVKDVWSFERLYFRIGWPSGQRAYETDLARATGRRIQEELLMVRAVRNPG